MKYKNILVLGLGISGVSIVKALSDLSDINIYIYDNKEKDKLSKSINQLVNIKYELNNKLEDINLDNIDLVVKSPGFPIKSKEIESIEKKNIEIITDIELFYKINHSGKVVAVTGTNGKTTTVSIIKNILDKKYKNTYLCGNIGIGVLDYVHNFTKEDIMVIEASSFQLNNIDKFRPNISIITNIKPDHLDWHGTYEEYEKAKLNIVKNQTSKDFTILNYNDEYLRKLSKDMKSKILFYSIDKVLEEGVFIENNIIKARYLNKNYIFTDIKNLKIFGKHNLQNILAAVGVGLLLGLNEEEIVCGIVEFNAISHRFEYIGKVNGVSFINDSKATNIDSVFSAIESVDKDIPINLILGGFDKGLDFSDLMKLIKDRVKNVVCLGQTSNKILSEAEKIGYKNIKQVSNMKEAVDVLFESSKVGDLLLLSPACASWGMYNNYEERGLDFFNNYLRIKEDNSAKKAK